MKYVSLIFQCTDVTLQDYNESIHNNTTRKQYKQKVEGTSLGNGSLGSGSMQFVANNNSPGEQVRARTMGTRNAFKQNEAQVLP